jgi:hypothetical protein
LIRQLGFAIATASLVLGLAGCGPGSGDLLGGRETCWREEERRVAGLWRGTFRVDLSGGWLDTPEGDAIPLGPGGLQVRVGDTGVGQLVRGSEVVATAGDNLTLFGGAGSDGVLVVCAIEEFHAEP